MSKKKSKTKISITFPWANSNDVAGSLTLIEIPGHDLKILYECGLIQKGGDTLLSSYKNNTQKFPFKPKEIDVLILGEFHGDHILLGPRLYKEGFRGKICIPEHGFKIYKEMMSDSCHIMEQDSLDLERKFKRSFPPIYTKEDVNGFLSLIEEYPLETKNTLDFKDEKGRPIIEFEYYPAQHIFNSCQTVMWLREKTNNIKKIAFTSDLGNIQMPVMYTNKFKPIEGANIIIGESTYCNEERSKRLKDRTKDLEKLKSTLLDTCVEHKASCAIPVFALGRTPVMCDVIYELMKNEESFKDIPIYISSPLGKKLLKIYHEELPDERQRERLDEILTWNNFKFLQSFDELEYTIKQGKPAVYLASSGMCVGGHITYILEKLLPNSKNRVLFCGYTVNGSIGARIKSGKQKSIMINGKQVSNKAGLVNLVSFSSHMQYWQLLDYYSSGNFDKIALVHGDKAEKDKFAIILQEEIYRKNRTGKVISVDKNMTLVV